MIELITRLLEQDNPEIPGEDDFDREMAKDVAIPNDPTAVNLSGDIWSDDALLKRAFTWLTQRRLGPKFGSRSIAAYQQDQVAALDEIKKLAAARNLSVRYVRWRRGTLQAFDPESGKWIPFARYWLGDLMPISESGVWAYVGVRDLGDWTLDKYVIYQFVKTENSPDGILLYKGTTKELTDAKQMIKSGDFRSRRARLGLPESEEDDFDEETVKDIMGGVHDMRHPKKWGIRVSKTGMLTIMFQGKPVGQEKHRTSEGARSAGLWTIADMEKRDLDTPFDPSRYADVWEWYLSLGESFEKRQQHIQ